MPARDHHFLRRPLAPGAPPVGPPHESGAAAGLCGCRSLRLPVSALPVLCVCRGFRAGVGGSPRETSPHRWLAPAWRISSVVVRRDWLWVGLEGLGAGGTKTTQRKVSQKRLHFDGDEGGTKPACDSPSRGDRGIYELWKNPGIVRPPGRIWPFGCL
ncbi:unnamed protein product [Pleuronectes platessa]|uniref:Uncharacterized protein n=1 Tax=Pleuronectes platessa TaxID=8262 RepID=A0A9N7VHL5_PLEPL|nr:unnamed protein product [Pleuronectes platessa]